jgi:hypothetical protein
MITLNRKSTLKAAFLVTCCTSLGMFGALPGPASAQNLMGMINQEMGSMNQKLANNQLRINGMVNQKMRDPKVRSGYAQYVARARQSGIQPQSYFNYSYNYIATQGFSRPGIAVYRANEARNSARIASATADLRSAQAARGQAQLGMQQAFSNNQREFGNLLRGTSTYAAPSGRTRVLPHTWQANTYQQYEGGTYYVDFGGRYHALGSDGTWTTLSPR